jgi:signal peptidase I
METESHGYGALDQKYAGRTRDTQNKSELNRKPMRRIGQIEPMKPAVSTNKARSHRLGPFGRPVSPNDAVSLFYKGPSMNPVLNSPDILHVRPYGRTTIQCGDVVVFPSPAAGFKVVHRVVSAEGNEIRTKGDNNPHVDSWTLKPEKIIGRVEWIERDGKRIRIYGGWRGRAQAEALKAARLFGSGVRFVLRPLYRRLSRNRVLKQWLAERSLTRVISISRPEGIELQLLLGRRVIGRRPAGRRTWHIRRPFLFVVDEDSLPHISER